MATRVVILLTVLCGITLGKVVDDKEHVHSQNSVLTTSDTTLDEDLTEHDHSQNSVLTTSDLYWKPFTGLPVPDDAILAGVRKIDGESVGVHIGQVLIEDVPGAHLQAVAIYNNSDSVTSTYTRTVTTTEKIKILCGNKDASKKLKWVSYEDQDKYTPDKDFVLVGHEMSKVSDTETKIYIGRGTYDDTFLVGKVVMGSKSLRFYPYYQGEEVLLKENFEILAYA